MQLKSAIKRIFEALLQELTTTVNSIFQLSKMHKPYTEFTSAAYSSFCNSVPCTVFNKPYTVLDLSAIGNTGQTPYFIILITTLRCEDNFRTINFCLTLKKQLTLLNHQKKNEQQKRLHRKCEGVSQYQKLSPT